jgi:hypothetical protein
MCSLVQVIRVWMLLAEETLAMPRFEVELLLVDYLSGGYCVLLLECVLLVECVFSYCRVAVG